MRVRHAPTRLISVGAAPAAERPDPGAALVIDDVIGVPARIARVALSSDKTGKPEPGANFDQHVLERTNIAIRDNYRLPDRIGRAPDAAHPAVEHRYAV